MENLGRLLREHPFLRDLDADQVEFMVSCAKNLRFERDSYLFHEGDPANSLFLLRSGRVALESQMPGRGVTQLESLGEGDIVGLSWLAPPYRFTLDARAVETTISLVFDGTCLRTKMKADERFGYAITLRILQEVVRRLDRVRLQRMDLYGTER